LHPVPKENPLSRAVRGILAQVRFLAYHRIKPHAPPLVRAPVNSFEFHPCGRTPQVGYLSVSLGHSHVLDARTPSIHRLRCGLPGYLILFAPHTFVPQRQFRPSDLPSQSVFCVISMHFTATPRIPTTSDGLKPGSINGSSPVEREDFTTDLPSRLRTL
jgi:hypothetical protein